LGEFININGKILSADQPALQVDNRATRHGYGLFETMFYSDGRIRLENFHWERLFSGLELLLIEIPAHFKDHLSREIHRTVAKNKLERFCRVRLQVDAGNGGFYDGDPFMAQYHIEVFTLEASIGDFNEAGLVTGISSFTKEMSAVSALKTCSGLIYALAAREVKSNKWNDAILLNQKGNVVESTIANLFWCKDGQIFTPPLSEGCIAGSMRRYLLENLGLWGYPISEMLASPRQIKEADAVWLSNSIRPLRWIRLMDEQEYEPGLTPEIYYKVVKSLNEG